MKLAEIVDSICEHGRRQQLLQPCGIGGRFKLKVKDYATKQVVKERDWQTNIFTNHGLTKIATDIPYAEAMVCCALSTDEDDVRFPEFVLDSNGDTDIDQRTAGSVVISNTTTEVNIGDQLHYPSTQETFYVISKVVGGGNTTLTLLNPDNTTPTGTTAAGTEFFIYYTSKKQFTIETKRAGTRSGVGSTPASGSDPATDGGLGFISGQTQTPVLSGHDGAVSTALTSGAVSSVSIDSAGADYADQAAPLLALSGGGAGQLITGAISGVLSDGGQLLNGGTGYSNTPGDVTLEVLGAGGAVAGQFTVTVAGGVITGVTVNTAGEGFFSDTYSTAAGTLRFTDVTGSGSGGSIVLTPRRQAKLEAHVSGGGITLVRIIYAGYKLTSAPLVEVVSTSYVVHERVFAFTEEVGNFTYYKVGVSWDSGEGGADLTAMMSLRNSSTGAADPLEVLTGQQAEVTYQLIVNYAPTMPTYRESSKVGGWWRQDGSDRNDGFGLSEIQPDGNTLWKDSTYFANEPFYYDMSQLSYYAPSLVDIGVAARLQFFISENGDDHSGSWGTQTARGGADNECAGLKTPTVSYINDDDTIAPYKVTKKAVFSLGAGNDVSPIRSFGLGFKNILTGDVTRECYSYVYSDATIAQNVLGRPRKDEDHRITLELDIFLSRRLAV